MKLVVLFCRNPTLFTFLFSVKYILFLIFHSYNFQQQAAEEYLSPLKTRGQRLEGDFHISLAFVSFIRFPTTLSFRSSSFNRTFENVFDKR